MVLPNSKRYAPPYEGYYDLKKDQVAYPRLVEAVSKYTDASLPKDALDFGCGSGFETRYLLEQGYSVIAVDGNEKAKACVEELPHQEKVRFIRSDFETFDFDTYSLINSSFSLPFTHKDDFPRVFSGLAKSIRPHGLFVGNLFGLHDQWNKPDETMTFLSHADVRELLKNFEILKLGEEEKDGQTANGKEKHWHTFDIIARKK